MLTAGIMFHDILSAFLNSLRRKVRSFVLRPAMLRRQMLMWSASPPTSSLFGFPSLAKASSTSFAVGDWQKVSQGNLGVHQGPGGGSEETGSPFSVLTCKDLARNRPPVRVFFPSNTDTAGQPQVCMFSLKSSAIAQIRAMSSNSYPFPLGGRGANSGTLLRKTSVMRRYLSHVSSAPSRIVLGVLKKMKPSV